MNEKEWLTSKDPQAMLRYYLTDEMSWPRGKPAPVVSSRKIRLLCCAIARLLGNVHHPDLREVVDACEQVADNQPTKWGKGGKALVAARESIDAVWGWVWCCTTKDISSTILSTIFMERGNAGSFYRQDEVADLVRDIIENPYRVFRIVHSNVWKGSAEAYNDPIIIESKWLTPTVLSLAESAYRDRTVYDTLDNLTLQAVADALEEAGCYQEGRTQDFVTTYVCPECGDKGFWRSGQEFDHMKKCRDRGCGMVWIPGETLSKKVRASHPVLDHLRSDGPHYRGCWAVDLLLGKS